MAECDGTALSWAITTLSPGALLVEVCDLHDGFGPWLVRCAPPSSSPVYAGVLRVAADAADGKGPQYVRTEAAAMRIAEQFGVAAPRLVGLDAEGRSAGRVASVQSVVDGEPLGQGPYSADRLFSLGERLASVHRVSIEPSAELPIRRRAMDGGEGFLTERRRYAGSARWVAGKRLLRRAEAELAQRPRPRDRIGLVHGDAWVGNAMALDGRCSGLFDWGSAGVGHPGVDVGYARLSAALTYGVHAAADVLAGWEAGTGEPLASIAYWDVVAALVTPPDLGPATDVRDAFLLRALDATSPPA